MRPRQERSRRRARVGSTQWRRTWRRRWSRPSLRSTSPASRRSLPRPVSVEPAIPASRCHTLRGRVPRGARMPRQVGIDARIRASECRTRPPRRPAARRAGGAELEQRAARSGGPGRPYPAPAAASSRVVGRLDGPRGLEAVGAWSGWLDPGHRHEPGRRTRKPSVKGRCGLSLASQALEPALARAGRGPRARPASRRSSSRSSSPAHQVAHPALEAAAAAVAAATTHGARRPASQRLKLLPFPGRIGRSEKTPSAASKTWWPSSKTIARAAARPRIGCAERRQHHDQRVVGDDDVGPLRARLMPPSR